MLVIIIMLLPAAQVSAGRINEVLSAESSVLEGSVTESPETGTVEFRDVSFHYPDGGDVLEHISFKANKGETVAFIGATGLRQDDAGQPADALLRDKQRFNQNRRRGYERHEA